MSRWTVKSVINNNVVSARNERNQERILTGRGIGFRAKPGDEVDASRVEKEFFLIPEEYVTQGGDNGSDGVIRQCYLEDGTISSEFVETEVYYYDSDTGEYYLDVSILNSGDVLHKTDSQETYTVSKRATLIGVYNMNKGYADFKQINILYQNDEYSIVEANTRYGLNVYDYIVLDAEAVSDDQFIYE